MNKIYYNFFWFIGVLFLLSSCLSPKQTNLLQQREPIYPAKEFEEYRIQVNDELDCIILTSNKELSSSFNGVLTNVDGLSNNYRSNARYYTVFENGNIHIPFFGEMNILDMTLNEAEDVIQKRMRESFPDALVRLRLRNNIFYIVSSGKNGTYNIFKDNMTIYQALSISGNIDPRIDLTKVKILRNENGKDIIKTFNLRTESVIESEFYYIKPNDVIYYTTSKSSFFKADSFTSFVGTILAPVSFLAGMLAWKFW